MNLCYFSKSACRLVDAGCNYGMFQAAASALDNMIATWRSPVSAEDIRKASMIVNFVANDDVGQAVKLV